MIEKNPHIPQSSIEIYTAPDNTEEKDVMVKVVVNLINKKN